MSMSIPPVGDPSKKESPSQPQQKKLSPLQKSVEGLSGALGYAGKAIGNAYASMKAIVLSGKPTKEQIDQLKNEWSNSSKVKLPKDIDKDGLTLFDKLSERGIGPNDIPFQTVWLKAFVAHAANAFFGPEGEFGNFPPEGTYFKILLSPNPEFEKAKTRMSADKNGMVLNFDQAFYDAPLPEEFINTMRGSGSIVQAAGNANAPIKAVVSSRKPSGTKMEQLKKEWVSSEKMKSTPTSEEVSIMLMDKLSELGIGPNDIPFQTVWVKPFSSHTGNAFFGPEGEFGNPPPKGTYYQILVSTNELFERAKRGMEKEENGTALAVNHLSKNGSLPAEFIRNITKSNKY